MEMMRGNQWEEHKDTRKIFVCNISGSQSNTQKASVPRQLPVIEACATEQKTQTLKNNQKGAPPRIRSASTGRDKKCELQARYWALLFGNLQRVVNEIYQTVECYENLSSCQEVILVLENYIRDFKALAEWFKVSWDYEATPQRTHSLAWEVRKSNPLPRFRNKSASSRGTSPHSSPSFSGKNSPCLKEAKLKRSIAEAICSGKDKKPVCKFIGALNPSQDNFDETAGNSESEHKQEAPQNGPHAITDMPSSADMPLEVGLATLKSINEMNEPKSTDGEKINSVGKLNQYSQTNLEHDNLTLAEFRAFKKEKGLHTNQLSNSKSVDSVLEPNKQHIPGITASAAEKPNQSAKPMVGVKTTSVSSGRNTSANVPPLRRIFRAHIVARPAPAKNERLKIGECPRYRSSMTVPVAKRDPKNTIFRSCSSLTSNFFKPLPKADGREMKPKSILARTENDGWFTVKARRRSQSYWENRFNRPSAFASLPTLAGDQASDVLDSDSSNETGTKHTADKSKVSETVKDNLKVRPARLKSSLPKKTVELCIENGLTKEAKPPPKAVLRQSSDLTGLKLKNLRKEYQRSEKILTTVQPSLNQSATVRFDTDQNGNNNESLVSIDNMNSGSYLQHKVDINIQTNSTFSSAMNDLYNQAHSGGDKEGTSTVFSCDELEDNSENDDDQRMLLEEQENLERQIRELENIEIEVDTETDENDCEAIVGISNGATSTENLNAADNNDEFNEEMSLEMRYQYLLSDMTLRERVETLATLQAFVARHPGRAQELHQKLSSPSRQRSLHETLKTYQAKQAKAQEKREILQKERALKIQHLLTRVEDVKMAKQHLIDSKRHRMEERLQKAEENRNQYIKHKVRKAHDEESKLKEIAFIKNIEAQNKRLDLIESCKEHEGRLQDLEQERQKRVEEKAAKDAAVERRRLELDLERQRRLEKMSETRKEREKRIGKMQEQREKMRQAIAREKAKDREERLLALQAHHLARTEEWQRKIVQKQQESARRHEESIEQIRQRAQELSVPNRNIDENILNDNIDEMERPESPNQRIVKSKYSQKKLKKLRARLTQRSTEYFAELQVLPRHIKSESQIPKLLAIVNKGGGAQGIERPLGQINRLIAKAQVADFQCMWLLDGLKTIASVIEKGMLPNSEISNRAVLLSVQLYRNCCSLCPQIARHAVQGNSLSILLDALLISLPNPELIDWAHPVELSTELVLACTVALSPTKAYKQAHTKLLDHLSDLISYVVTTGLFSTMVMRCKSIKQSVENEQTVVLSLLAVLGLLTKFVELCPKGPSDSTRLFQIVKSTELLGTISLLHSTIVPLGECIPPRTISLAAAIFNLLVALGDLDLKIFQEVLSDETTSLKFLDVVKLLLLYCGPKSSEKGETQAVIIDLIVTLGFFCANNKSVQSLLNGEQFNGIIKTLAKLPAQLNVVIFPTLVALKFDNPDMENVIGHLFDLGLLREYEQSDMAKRNRIIMLINKLPLLNAKNV